jgi:signal peptidase II
MSYNPRMWLWLSALTVALDQASKLLAEMYLEPLRPVSLFPGFDLNLIYNSGAAFSFLRDAGGWQRYFFVGVTIVVVVVLVHWLRRLGPGQKTLAAGLALILGGGIGNLIDRIVTGQVVDFIDVYYAAWPHWPAFNLADTAISIGVGLLLLDALFLAGRASGD